MSISVGSVSVNVVPDATNFGRDLKAKLGRENYKVAVQVDVDSARAQADLAVLNREVDRLDGRNANIDVRVDDHGGLTKLAGESAGASGGLSGLVAAALAVSPALIPIGAAATAGLAGIAVAAGAGAAGLGVLALSFSGVSDAVKLIGQEHQAAAADAAKAAVTQVASAQAIAAAERQVQSAQASLANARANAGDAAVRSDEEVARAEQSLATAQAQARTAQEALTTARKAAKQAMEDLNLQVKDGALAQRQANLNVEQARQDLNRVLADPRATTLQRQQAQLTYDQALQQVKDLQVQQTRLRAQQQATAKAGVNGSTQVKQAQQGIATAVQNEAQARQGLNDAIRSQATQQRQSAFAISQAQAQVAASLLAVQQAADKAGQTAPTALSKIQAQLALLNPSALKFAQFIHDTLEPAFARIKKSAQDGLLPGVQTALQDLLPLLPVVDDLVGSLAKVMGDLAGQAAKALTSPFWRSFFDYLKTTAGPTLKIVGKVIGDFITGFAGLIQGLAPVTDLLGTSILGIADGFAALGKQAASGGSKGFNDFLDFVMKTGPQVWHTIEAVAGAIANVVRALAPFGAPILVGIQTLADIIAHTDPARIREIAGGIAAIAVGMKAMSVIQSIAPLLAAVFTPEGAIVVGVLALAAGVYELYQHSAAFRAEVKRLADYFTTTVLPVLNTIKDQALAGLKDAFNNVKDAVGRNKEQLGFLYEVFKKVADFVVQHVLPLMGSQLQTTFHVLGAVIGGLIDTIGDIVRVFKFMAGVILTSLSDIYSGFSGLFGLMAKVPGPQQGFFKGIADQAQEASDHLKRINKELQDLGTQPPVQIKVAVTSVGDLLGDRHGFAFGGAVSGPGTGRSDSIPAWLSNGEHVWTAQEVAAIGGHRVLEQMRKTALRGFADGGPVIAAQGTGYLSSLGRADYTPTPSPTGHTFNTYNPVPERVSETVPAALRRATWVLGTA